MKFTHCTLLVMRVAFSVWYPIMGLHVGSAIALHTAVFVFNDQVTVGTRSNGKLLDAGPLSRVKNVIFKTIAFRASGCGVIRKILSGRTWTWRLLLETFLSLVPVIDIPFGFAMTTGSTFVCVQIK